MTTKNIFGSIVIGCAALFMGACGSEGGSTPEQAAPEHKISELDESGQEVLEKAKTIFYAVPSPFELASLLKNTGSEFNGELLHNPEALSGYNTKMSKAINLGVYSVDLSYSSIYGQTKYTMGYLQSVKRLTDDFGISAAFTPEIMERLDANMDNQDSVQAIMAKAYLEANSYLKSNDMVTLSSFMLAGGWIEGLHIALGLLEQGENPEVTTLIAEQQFSLENLVDLLGVSGESSDIQSVKADFEKLLAVYNKIEQSDDGAVVVSTDDEGPAVIGGDESAITIAPEVLNEIKALAKEIRAKYVAAQ